MGEPGSPSRESRARRFGFWVGGLLLAGAFYLLLIDTTDPPELYAGAVVVVLAAAIFELSREQAFEEASASPARLLRVWRVLIRIPTDVATLTVVAFDQAIHRRPARGRLRAIDFDARGDDSRAVGRRALAEALGSVAPNTIVIGVDQQRRLLVAHQLERRGGRSSLDPLDLG